MLRRDASPQGFQVNGGRVRFSSRSRLLVDVGCLLFILLVLVALGGGNNIAALVAGSIGTQSFTLRTKIKPQEKHCNPEQGHVSNLTGNAKLSRMLVVRIVVDRDGYHGCLN